MANLHHKSRKNLDDSQPASEMLAQIQAFLVSCRSPAALEYGDEARPLIAGEHCLEERAGRLWIEVWCEGHSLSRRITSVLRQSPGVLECSIQLFGGAAGKLTFIDQVRPQAAHKLLAGERENFGEQFRRMLFRQFPDWEIETLSAAMDLRRSFSPVFPRARLRKGNSQIAAIACPDKTDEAALLTFGMLWFDHVAAHPPHRPSRNQFWRTELCLFLPEGSGCLTAQRLQALDSSKLPARIYLFNAHGLAGEVDPKDLGNLDTRVSPHFQAPQFDADIETLLGSLTALPGVGACPELNGAVSIRHRGTEFARVEHGSVLLGLEGKQKLTRNRWQEAKQFAEHLNSLAHAPGLTRKERGLETAVRSNIKQLDASIREQPIHGQVITFAALDRDLVDLLAIDATGRLVILELKTEEDIHLPLQALDYWTRVCWHLRRGEIDRLFPGIALSVQAPLLRLVAPALVFHSTSATLLRYFSPLVDVQRIGLSSNWSETMKVVLRLKGGDSPQSHGGQHEHAGFSRYQEGNRQPES